MIKSNVDKSSNLAPLFFSNTLNKRLIKIKNGSALNLDKNNFIYGYNQFNNIITNTNLRFRNKIRILSSINRINKVIKDKNNFIRNIKSDEKKILSKNINSEENLFENNLFNLLDKNKKYPLINRKNLFNNNNINTISSERFSFSNNKDNNLIHTNIFFNKNNNIKYAPKKNANLINNIKFKFPKLKLNLKFEKFYKIQQNKENDEVKILNTEETKPKKNISKIKNNLVNSTSITNNNSFNHTKIFLKNKSENKLYNDSKFHLSQYIIGHVLGKGSYATVKIATNILTKEKYAVKEYDRHEYSKNKIRKEFINNEIEILKKISHKNIVKLIDVVNTKHSILLIQEYIPGISLKQYYMNFLKDKEFCRKKEKTIKIILTQIFNAIDYLHKNYISHRDIKLENILINKETLFIKIIDFGFGIYNPNRKMQTYNCGTPSYIPPEMILKSPYLAEQADIWSLGVLVFKIFCDDYPFKGSTEQELDRAIKKGKYNIKRNVPYDVKKIINSMLVLEPQKRASCEILLKNKWFQD